MPEPGSRLGGHYTLLDRLGTGAAGEVWRARVEGTAAVCAVKLLRPELVQDEGALARLRATIAWIGQLAHPGIVAVQEVVAHGRTVALISRLVPGESLRALLDRSGTVPTGAALLLTAQLCDAVAAARRVGVAHGDVKPENLLLEPDPETELAVRLTDFGMAALLGRAAVQQAVSPNPAAGYAAPELGIGEGPTEAADVYAVGVALYEALTGQLPFGGETPEQGRRETPVAVPFPGDLPDSAATALAECFSEDPRRRPTAAALGAMLRQAAEEMQAEPQWPVVALAPEPRLDFFGAGASVPGDALLPARREASGSSVARSASSAVAVPPTRPAPPRARGPQPWTIVAAVLCGIALAAFITFGLTTRGSPHAIASPLPARVAVIEPTAGPTSQISATPTSTVAPTGSATPSISATAKPSPSLTTPSTSPATPAAPSPSNSGQPVSRTGRLYNYGASACLDTSGGYFANGVVEQIWGCDNGIGQVFTLTTTGQLTVDGGQYCLDDATSADATGTHAELWTCGGQSHQRWTERTDGSIVGDHSGLCLDVPGVGNGTQIDFEPCDGRPHQIWAWD